MAPPLLYYASFTILGLSMALLGPTLPGLAKQTQTSLGQISILFAAVSLGNLAGGLITGRLFDRHSGHILMGGGALVMFAFQICIPLVSWLWLLALLFLFLGIAQSLLLVGGNTLVLWRYQAKSASVMNAVHFCFGSGAFLAPILLAQVLQLTAEIRWAYWGAALPLILLGVWLLANSRSSPQPLPISSLSERSGYRSFVFWASVFLFLYVGAEVGFSGWIYSYAIAKEMANPITAGYLTSLFWLSLMIGRLFAAAFLKHFLPQRILRTNLVSCLVSLILLVVANESTVFLWVGTICLGLSMASTYPTLMTLAQQKVRMTGAIGGWFEAGASIGAMSIPWLIGQLFEPLGPISFLYVITVVVAMSFVIGALFLTQRGSKNGRSREPILWKESEPMA
jgi:FHS family Na+ dependent glucose MFS transporter 1